MSAIRLTRLLGLAVLVAIAVTLAVQTAPAAADANPVAAAAQDHLPPGQSPDGTPHPRPAVMRSEHGADKSESSLPPADPFSSNMLLYKGGAVQTAAHVYLVLWGDWSSANDPYNVAGRLYTFLRGVGGSGWNQTMVQYASGCYVNNYTCPSTATHITNSTGQFSSSSYWYDTTNPVPANPVSWNAIASEAIRGAMHFGVNGVNSTIIVALPRGHDDYLFTTNNGGACGWHDYTSGFGYTVPFIAQSYIPDAGSSCGNYSHGSILDGVTIVAGHEYQETESDPWATANGYMGWRDTYGSEEGDKCNWSYNNGTFSTNYTFSTGTFPIQPAWSNYYRFYHTSGCVWYS